MLYARFLCLEGWCWVAIGFTMIVVSWPGLLVEEDSVALSVVMGVVLSGAWLAVALWRRRVPARAVWRWMAGGRFALPGRNPRPMNRRTIILFLARDYLLWVGGTVGYYLLCNAFRLPPSVSNGAWSIGIGASVILLGALEAVAAGRVTTPTGPGRDDVETVVLRHGLMGFAGPVLDGRQTSIGASGKRSAEKHVNSRNDRD